MQEDQLTPAMKQYWKIKAEHPDCLLLFRMGDFYETFFEDAQIASKALGIALTKRGMKGGARIPLAGIPYHSLENYLVKLVKAGVKVAICEQLEDPKKAKGIVKRGLTRIVTPGTIIESELLEEKSNNYIAAVYPGREEAGIAYADITTGEFACMNVPLGRYRDELERIVPAETLFPETMKGSVASNPGTGFIPEWHFDRTTAIELLMQHFAVVSLVPFGLKKEDICLGPAGALLLYLKDTQQGRIQHLKPPRLITNSAYMVMDAITLRNLEVVKNISGGTENTLLDTIDSTQTPMGARMLKRWLLSPLMDVNQINERLLAVEELFRSSSIRTEISQTLGKIGDMERALSRISNREARTKDLLLLKLSLSQIPVIKTSVQKCSQKLFSTLFLPDLSDLCNLLERAISEDVHTDSCGIIRAGYDLELDNLKDMARNGKRHIAALQEKERQRTGIKSLKIGYNRIFGYYFEISRANLNLVPNDYIRKQTTVAGERFITQELKDWEDKVFGAEERIAILESELLAGVKKRIIEKTDEILAAASAIATIDCIHSLAETAVARKYTKPTVDDSFRISLKSSRHPVMECVGDSFIPNDVNLSEDSRFIVLTGPNMAGKSTYMRQIAQICILAQMGSFVPAKEAEIGVVDRIFTRVGAHDDLSHGQSTFMVEMNEVSLILNNATDRSLIIMDEIGRGTSTYDGISIAWSVALDIIERIRAKTLFATHYHSLTKLDKHHGVKNYHAAVLENKDRIVFTRRIEPGGTDKSYGIHVAKLAGMPNKVIEKAQEIQFKLEEDERKRDLIVVERKKRDQAPVLIKSSQRTLTGI